MMEEERIITEDKDSCLSILKEVINSEIKSQCRDLLSELNKSFSDSEKYPKEFENKIFAYKDLWLPYKIATIYTAGLHSYTKLATIKEIFENEVGHMIGDDIQEKSESSSDSVFTLLEKAEDLEKINETYYFKFS